MPLKGIEGRSPSSVFLVVKWRGIIKFVPFVVLLFSQNIADIFHFLHADLIDTRCDSVTRDHRFDGIPLNAEVCSKITEVETSNVQILCIFVVTALNVILR